MDQSGIDFGPDLVTSLTLRSSSADQVFDDLRLTTSGSGGSGPRAPGLEKRIAPRGDKWLAGAGELTDYLFTGQRYEEGLGLYWYRSRWYDPLLGRWVQADSIIPEPYNLLAYDRYQYVYSNPLRYVDPSGHTPAKYLITDADYLPAAFYEVKFKGDWPSTNMVRAMGGVRAVGAKFARELGGSAVNAFQAVYGGITLGWGNCLECEGGGGYTYSAHLIRFASLSEGSQRAVNNVIHELGHVFDWVVAGIRGVEAMPRNVLGRYWDTQEFPRRVTPCSREDYLFYGLAGPRNERLWHQNPSGSAAEEFADTFLGWVMGAWETKSGVLSPEALARAGFMSNFMPRWLWISVSR